MIESRPITAGSEVWVCQACGRASQSQAGHDRPTFCYGCGAQLLDHHLPGSDFGKLHGPLFYRAGYSEMFFEFPGDVQYDPWTGETGMLDSSPMGPTLEDWQFERLRVGGIL